MSRTATSPLPEPPADPLHILPPESLLMLLAAAGMLFLILAWLVVRRFLRRRPPSPAGPPPPSPQPLDTVPAETGIATRIKALERTFLDSKAFREGCHALAAVVKSHLARSTGLAVEHMTSPEIARAVEDQRIGRFMTYLGRRRYGREEPRRKHLVEACGEARELLA